MRSAEAPSTHPHRQLRELGSCGMASCKWVTANNDDWVRGTMTGEGASGDGQGGPQGAHQGDLQGGQVRHPSALYLPMCSTPYTGSTPSPPQQMLRAELDNPRTERPHRACMGAGVPCVDDSCSSRLSVGRSLTLRVGVGRIPGFRPGAKVSDKMIISQFGTKQVCLFASLSRLPLVSCHTR